MLEFDEVKHVRDLFGIDMEVDLFDVDFTRQGIAFVFVFFRTESDQCLREKIHGSKNCTQRERQDEKDLERRSNTL